MRDASFDVLRELGLTKIFSSTGSTGCRFTAGLPRRPRIQRTRPARSSVSRHKHRVLRRARQAGLRAWPHHGTGLRLTRLGALATARVNRAPLAIE